MRRELFFAVLVAGATSCGLIDAFSGDLSCDADGLCSCPAAPEAQCIGEGCRCDDDGQLVCTDVDTICSLLDDDGCANDACNCHDRNGGECSCSEAPGVCSTGNGSIVSALDGSDSCIGNCECSAEEGCACLDADCAYGVDGAVCTTDDDCQVLQMASETGCTAEDAGCIGDEFCGQLPGGETGCFVPGDCSRAVAVERADGGGSTVVCVSANAEAVCRDGVCADSVTD